jgi:hypothetical protein
MNKRKWRYNITTTYSKNIWSMNIFDNFWKAVKEMLSIKKDNPKAKFKIKKV